MRIFLGFLLSGLSGCQSWQVNTSMTSCYSQKICRGIAYNIEYLR